MTCSTCTTSPREPCRRPLRLSAIGLTIARIPFGQEPRHVPGARCPTCTARLGDFHHVGCSVEQCGACAGAAWKCGCGAPEVRVVEESSVVAA